jgi:hypothetical protein
LEIKQLLDLQTKRAVPLTCMYSWIAWSRVFQKNEGIEDKKSNEVAGEVKELGGGGSAEISLSCPSSFFLSS